MDEITASAPGKIILFGEHAVVYGRPALAAPLSAIRAHATIRKSARGTGVRIVAMDLSAEFTLAEAAANGLSMMAENVLNALEAPEPDIIIEVKSEIPIAAGLGSGAAVSAALGRAMGEYLGQSFTTETLSALVYKIEKYYHGTPSGIDNTVICYEKPVYFVKGQNPDVFSTKKPVHLLIGDTGVPSPTKETVGYVREQWLVDEKRYETLFDEVEDVVEQAREALMTGRLTQLGTLMNRNQRLLQQIGVSSGKLDRLVEAANKAGADGAKLSGGGGGGNMIALVKADTLEAVREALISAGAPRVLQTTITQ